MKLEETEKKMAAEEHRRKECLKQAQIENLKRQREIYEAKIQERNLEKIQEDKKALDAKAQHEKFLIEIEN